MAFTANQMKGVIPALVTPFDREGNFDPARTRQVVRFLLGKNVHGLYLTGSTGEGFLMSPEERKEAVEVVLEEVNGKIPVIVHIGAIGSKISADLAIHARKAGADGVSSVPPFYFKFGPENIRRYYEEVAAAAELPLFLYNIALAGAMDFSLIRQLSQIPGVAGMKFTAPAQHEFLRIRQELPKDFVIFSGADEMAMSGFAYGADGIIGSFYNLIPEVFLTLYAAYQKGDNETMLRMQDMANKVIYLTLEYDMVSLIKQMMGWMGADAGYARSPFKAYSNGELAEIRERFKALRLPPEEAEFFQAIAR